MREPLWRSREVAAIIGADAESENDIGLYGVSINLDDVRPGDIFITGQFAHQDTSDLVAEALVRGASRIIVREHARLRSEAGPLLRVSDPHLALKRLGAAARKRSEARIIGITGSVGKTSTKEALACALSASSPVHASQKNYNGQWGVPLSLARLSPDARFGVFEVGMSQPGDIMPLAKMMQPHIAIVTAIQAAHLEFFESLEHIADEKASVFQGLEPSGVAIVNSDTPHFERLADRARNAGAEVVSFGEDRKAQATILDLRLLPDASYVKASILGKKIEYRIGMAGRHAAVNSLAVLCAVMEVGANVDRAIRALSEFTPVAGRGRRISMDVDGGSVLIIDESANANPASMQAALAALALTSRETHPRRIAILGDMLELGAASDESHRGLARPLEEAGIDVLFACGPYMRGLFETVRPSRTGAYAATSDLLREPVFAEIRAGDVVMIKGSAGSRMELLVKALENKMSVSRGKSS
jgi:UDP-N-acetylmuramoyl-tripeptide--D-alanyl-D-alanine ligase